MKGVSVVRNRTKTVVIIATCVALVVLSSVLSIPIPVGVPVTLQTFAVALVGFLFGSKIGGAVVVCFILIGMTGLPVFSSFGGGVGVLAGATGGFIFGFIPFILLVGAGRNSKAKYPCVLLGLLTCHAVGVLQYALVTHSTLETAIAVSSLPFILKDVVLVLFAEQVSRRVSVRLSSFGV